MATCNQCGHELPNEGGFCANCGAAVNPAEASSQQPPEDEPVQSHADEGENVRSATTQIPKEVRNMAMLCHLAGFLGYVGIPFGSVLGPLLVWLLKREDSDFIDSHGKESLNFQISVLIYAIVSVILIYVIIGIPMLIALVVFSIIVMIKAAIRASNGQKYRYPLTIRIIR